jgi:hypothetical protein
MKVKELDKWLKGEIRSLKAYIASMEKMGKDRMFYSDTIITSQAELKAFRMVRKRIKGTLYKDL